MQQPPNMSSDQPPTTSSQLTEQQRDRIVRNRNRAILLKNSKLATHPYAKADITSDGKTTINVQGTKFVDSGGGFLLDPNAFANNKAGKNMLAGTNCELIEEDTAIQLPPVYEKCLDCQEKYTESYLMTSFGYSVCDKCRDPDDKHSLITRSESKNEYLLKDCDLDKREPLLRYISRKNPHNERWGEMKLYLHLQIEQRAIEVWGSEEGLMKEREVRDEKRDKTKLKKYNKNLKQLRMEMRSSLFDRTAAGPHQHDFGDETYDEEEDMYSKVCVECGFVQTYEKM